MHVALSSKTLQQMFGLTNRIAKPWSRSLLSKFINVMATLAAVDRAMYLASVVESATMDCNLDFQMIRHRV